MTDRTELRRLAEAATPGPWRKRWYGSGGYEGREGVTVVTNTGTVNCDEIAYLGRGDHDEDTAHRSRNGAFIAAASPDVVLGLLDEIDHADATMDRMVEECLNDSVKSQAWDDRVKLADAIAERDQLREDAKHALVIVGNVGRELGQTQHERDQLRAEIEDRIKAFDICHRQAMDTGHACIVAERERDQLREVLGIIAEFDPAVTHGWAECVREMARSALKAR